MNWVIAFKASEGENHMPDNVFYMLKVKYVLKRMRRVVCFSSKINFLNDNFKSSVLYESFISIGTTAETNDPDDFNSYELLRAYTRRNNNFWKSVINIHYQYSMNKK